MLSLAILGLLVLVQTAVNVVGILSYYGFDLMMLGRTVALHGVLGLGLLVSAALVAGGRDGGRILAVALAGAVCWTGSAQLTITGVQFAAMAPPSPSLSQWDYYLSLALSGLGGLLAMVVIATMGARATSDWLHQKRNPGGPIPRPTP